MSGRDSGGGELAALLVDAPDAGVEAARSRLERHIGAYHGGQPEGSPPLSVSLGMTVSERARHATVHALVLDADERKYRRQAGPEGRVGRREVTRCCS